jgi:glycosyltransferase involved in cell wall biosynthesis
MLLHEQGYEVLLVGRVLPNSLPMDERAYQAQRMKLLFTKGVAFYAEFTIRLFLFLLKNKAQLLVANDLDTLFPNYYFSKRRKINLIYDSHEIFCEVPELQHNPLKKSIWERMEKAIVPKIKYGITVNQSIADWFNKKYKTNFKVVRNIPDKIYVDRIKSKEELRLPLDKKIILLQGAGINIQRGAEEAVEAMQHINHAILLIIGSGDAIEQLAVIKKQLALEGKVIILPKMKAQELYHYTCNADIGLSLDKATNLNYQYSLPNKLFDYAIAGVPILASPLTEIKSFIEKYNIGICIDNHNPKHIAEKINFMLSSNDYTIWKANTLKASKENNWDKEKQVWIDILNKINR